MLTEKAIGFLRARGFEVEQRDPNFLVAQQQGFGGENERTCVWVLPQEARRGRQMMSLEEEYLGRFRGISERWRGARLYLLVDTMEGLSLPFRTDAKRKYGVTVQVPAQFFDMLFKHEAARSTVSAVGELVKEAEAYEGRRVPQAYEEEDGASGSDLVQDLLREIEAPESQRRPRVWFVVAPAGHGKSIFFSSLFGRLYRRFLERKSAQVVYPRPLPMIPAHVREAAGPSVKGLIDAFMHTDVAIPAGRPLFDWMIDNRHAVWMIDGLDEIITGDERFFEYVEERITAPRSCPAVVICVRDSLFRSSESLMNFRSSCGSYVKIFRLRPWDRHARRVFAWIHLQGRAPRNGEQDPPHVSAFLRSIERSPALQDLASTPFYADLLVKNAHDLERQPLGSAGELLELAVSEMCRREYAKAGALRDERLPMAGFREWLEEFAALSYEEGGVSAAELRELADLAMVFTIGDLGEEEKKAIVEQITMAPFLTQSVTSGRLELTHEILTEYLAGRQLAREFASSSPRFADRLSRRAWPADSVMFAVLAGALQASLDRVVELPVAASLPAEGFRNVVQLIAMIKGGDTMFRSGRLVLDGARLGAIRLRGLNLNGVSFRGCDLTNVDFEGASLQGAHFEGALLSNTRFTRMPDGAMDGTVFGTLEHFESTFVGDGKRVDDHRVFSEWLARRKGSSTASSGSEPCPTARQILHLFMKFVHVDGQARRDALDRRAIVRGKQVPGAPAYEDCVSGALDVGYLEKAQFDRIRRPTGAAYGEMVNFVKGGIVSPGIRSLLGSLCRLPGCGHVPHGPKPS
ncbi:MAG: hypothetical protein A3I00_08845 [Betaproteobacteria bacterium RIFCSPLOWO2_02_FULL_64_12]|nr:MAG: hypothetical protein A3I00_08845 [Betaproteobacteria bacterium RIFCSPLOWO2_02_FULL_64_12]